MPVKGEVLACVVLNRDLAAAEAASERLAYYKAPGWIHVLSTYRARVPRGSRSTIYTRAALIPGRHRASSTYAHASGVAEEYTLSAWTTPVARLGDCRSRLGDQLARLQPAVRRCPRSSSPRLSRRSIYRADISGGSGESTTIF